MHTKTLKIKINKNGRVVDPKTGREFFAVLGPEGLVPSDWQGPWHMWEIDALTGMPCRWANEFPTREEALKFMGSIIDKSTYFYR